MELPNYAYTRGWIVRLKRNVLHKCVHFSTTQIKTDIFLRSLWLSTYSMGISWSHCRNIYPDRNCPKTLQNVWNCWFDSTKTVNALEKKQLTSSVVFIFFNLLCVYRRSCFGLRAGRWVTMIWFLFGMRPYHTNTRFRLLFLEWTIV